MERLENCFVELTMSHIKDEQTFTVQRDDMLRLLRSLLEFS